MLLQEFSLSFMFHIDESIFDIDPERGFIMNICMLFAWFFYFEKGCFLSFFPIPHDSDDITEFKIKYTCFFTKFSYSCFFDRFSDFASTFWEHQCPFFMTDAEELYCSTSFASTNTACAWLQPKKGRNIPF